MEESEVAYDRSFLEMGLDSIVGVEWIRHLNKTYGMDLESTRLYQYPTLMELAGYICSLRSAPEKETAVKAKPEEEKDEPIGKLRSLTDAENFRISTETVTPGPIRLTPTESFACAGKEPVNPNVSEAKAPEVKKKKGPDLEETMKDLAESLARELFMDVSEIRYDQGFMEMGLDSIVGVEWMRYINRKYGMNMESTRIYQYPTVIELARYIVSLSDGPEVAAAELRQEEKPRQEEEPEKKPEETPAAGDDLDALLEKIYSGEIDLDGVEGLF